MTDQTTEQEQPTPKMEILIQDFDGQINVQPVKDETAPKTVDEVYAAICILKSNIEVQRTAQAVQSAMIQAAQEMQAQANGQTPSGIVIPENKNIR